MSQKVVRYYSTNQIKQATLHVMQKLNIKNKPPEKQYQENAEEIYIYKEEDIPSSVASQDMLVSKDILDNGIISPNNEEEALKEIFNTPDVPSSCGREKNIEEDIEEAFIEESEFIRCLVLLKGIVSMIRDKSVDAFGSASILDNSQEASHPVYTTLMRVSQQLRSQEELAKSLPMINDAVSCICVILNTSIDHVFIKDAYDICVEFIKHTLNSLDENSSEDAQYYAVMVLASFGASVELGRFMIGTSIFKICSISDNLREADKYGCPDLQFLQSFSLIMNLLLELWPIFLSTLFPHSSTGRRKEKEKRKSVENSVSRPKLSLSMTSELIDEAREWRNLLAECTTGLSFVQIEFCEAVWKLDSFCQGLLSSLFAPS